MKNRQKHRKHLPKKPWKISIFSLKIFRLCDPYSGPLTRWALRWRHGSGVVAVWRGGAACKWRQIEWPPRRGAAAAGRFVTEAALPCPGGAGRSGGGSDRGHMHKATRGPKATGCSRVQSPAESSPKTEIIKKTKAALSRAAPSGRANKEAVRRLAD